MGENGKACFLVGVNTVVDWQPVKLDISTKENWFNVKLTEDGDRQQFTLESQGLTQNQNADIYFQCRVFKTEYDADSGVSRPISEQEGKIVTSGIEWMGGENYLKNFQPFSGGVNPKDEENYKKCFQPSFSDADCNINEYDYQNWHKPMTAVKIDMNQIHSNFPQSGDNEVGKTGYEFKCNAYAQNIIAPIYVEDQKVYYEGDGGEPVVQSGGRDLHQNFIIQF